MSEHLIKDMLEAVCNNNAERLRELCTEDFMLVMDNGDIINGLDDYVIWLGELHQQHKAIKRDVIETISEANDDGTAVAVYTNNHVTHEDGKIVEFNDFTQFHINNDGQIDMVRQGHGVFRHLIE
jgi:ketosteroid isomerase-like protein